MAPTSKHTAKITTQRSTSSVIAQVTLTSRPPCRRNHARRRNRWQCSSAQTSTPPHQLLGVDLIILVLEAPHIHGQTDREPQRVLPLNLTVRLHRQREASALLLSQRAQQIMG